MRMSRAVYPALLAVLVCIFAALAAVVRTADASPTAPTAAASQAAGAVPTAPTAAASKVAGTLAARMVINRFRACLLYTSDAADE